MACRSFSGSGSCTFAQRHQGDEDERDRPGIGVEIGCADRDVVAEGLRDERIERAVEDDTEHDREQQVVDHQGGLAAHRLEGRAFLHVPDAQAEQQQGAADIEGEQGEDEAAARGIDREAVHAG